ncbi:MAG: ABC transporter permease [Intestinibacter bartlettii]|uniref:ABC transporter permease n=1 Tax=Intestinibacter bartlettii TaxID=261299 RepID=UPI0026F28A6A|nr:ABC transporter permease [Intestinibacter bartlettii]MDO5009258.1 ABC transporter permease [Intestinibacter bartlettii]
MILLTLIKKEIIQFFRNKTDVIVMLIFPVILIFVMGKSLNGLMSMDKNIFCGKTIYYNIEQGGGENNNVQVFYDFITEFQKNSDIKFVQSKDTEKAKLLVNKDEAICFINIRGDDIDYFRNENKESTESKVFRNLYEQYMKKYTFLRSISKTNPTDVQKILSAKNNTKIKYEGISYDEVNSFTYYTFVELTLIILYISTITSISMYKERFLHTMTRLKVSNIKKINIIISKIALGVVIGFMQILIIYICSTKLFDVDWGENLIYILMVLLSFIIFSSVLGIFMSMVFSDQKTAYTFSNMLIIVMGFLGGSYVPLCLVKSARVTSFICQLIPNYWVNVALLGLNYNIQTPYYITAISISLGGSILMIVLGNIISKLKEGGSFD